MDVATAVALANAAAAGAAGAAGQSAWQALVSLVRGARGRDGRDGREAGAAVEAAPDATVARPVPETGGAEARALAERAGELAHADAEFAGRLSRWAEEHRTVLRAEQSRVENTVSGDATVHGPVIQARDIHGGINLG